MQIEQQKEQEQQEREQPIGESNPYSLFVYAVRSQVTRDYYLRRLRIFFNHINLLPGGTMEQRCNLFAVNGLKDPNWARLVRIHELVEENYKKIVDASSVKVSNDVTIIKSIQEIAHLLEEKFLLHDQE